MIPKLDKFSLGELKVKLSQQNNIIFRELEQTASSECPNCGGQGYLWFQEIKGPIPDPLYAGAGVTSVEGKWFSIVEDIMYPCPACNSGSREKMFQYLWGDAGLEEHQRSWRIDYIQGKPGKQAAYQVALGLLEQTPKPSGLMFLYGPYGRGKSGIMKSLVAQFVQAGVPAHYVRANDILQRIRNSYNGGREISEQEISNAYAGYQFLAIDEIDVASDTSWAQATLRTIIDKRYELRTVKATALASNVTKPEELWGYLASRLQDGYNLFVTGDDLRGQDG